MEKSHTQITDLCAPSDIAYCTKNLISLAPQLREVSLCPKLGGGRAYIVMDAMNALGKVNFFAL
jgi:hypothetical protein